MLVKMSQAAGLVAALLLVSSAADAAPDKGARIADVLADRNRPDADRAKDAARHPAELLAFLKIRAGATIADIWPGEYWDRLFGDLVGPKGTVYAVHLVEGDKDDDIATPPPGSTPLAGHTNVVTVVTHADTLTLPAKADLIWIRQNYHDLYDPFMGPADVVAFNKAVFHALKPGGRFVVIDHVAPPGSGLEATNTTHRIDPLRVKADMAAAGLRFVGESDVLRNAADPHTGSVLAAPIRGHTDQFVYVFQRP